MIRAKQNDGYGNAKRSLPFPSAARFSAVTFILIIPSGTVHSSGLCGQRVNILRLTGAPIPLVELVEGQGREIVGTV
jgi:hypothetical protein